MSSESRVPSRESRAFEFDNRMSYRDLIAWQKGMELVKAIYDATDSFPQHELYGLVSQLRRAAILPKGKRITRIVSLFDFSASREVL